MAKPTSRGPKIDPAFMAANNAFQALNGLEGDELTIAVAMLSQRLGMTVGGGGRQNGTASQDTGVPGLRGGATPAAKAFVASKNTTKDIERVTVYGFYLVHHQDMESFKAKDIDAFRASVRGPALPDASVSMDNATKAGYMTSVGGGRKGITARGEALVKALPDRAAVNAALGAHPLRARRTKKIAKKGKGSN